MFQSEPDKTEDITNKNNEAGTKENKESEKVVNDIVKISHVGKPKKIETEARRPKMEPLLLRLVCTNHYPKTLAWLQQSEIPKRILSVKEDSKQRKFPSKFGQYQHLLGQQDWLTGEQQDRVTRLKHGDYESEEKDFTLATEDQFC